MCCQHSDPIQGGPTLPPLAQQRLQTGLLCCLTFPWPWPAVLLCPSPTLAIGQKSWKWAPLLRVRRGPSGCSQMQAILPCGLTDRQPPPCCRAGAGSQRRIPLTPPLGLTFPAAQEGCLGRASGPRPRMRSSERGWASAAQASGCAAVT